MSTVLVYRVEDSEGGGPYFSVEEGVWNALSSIPDADDERHPLPADEGLRYHRGLVCGFESVASAIAWFTSPVLAQLACLGLPLYGFTVPEEVVQWGNKQVVFDRDAAVQRVRVR